MYKNLYSTLIADGKIHKTIINDMFLKIDIIDLKIKIINFFLYNNNIVDINKYYDSLIKKNQIDSQKKIYLKFYIDILSDEENKNRRLINELKQLELELNKINVMVDNELKKLDDESKKNSLEKILTNIKDNLKLLNNIKQKLEDDIFDNIKLSFFQMINDIKSIKNSDERDNFINRINLLLDDIDSHNNTFEKYKDNISTIKKKLNLILDILSKIHFAS